MKGGGGKWDFIYFEALLIKFEKWSVKEKTRKIFTHALHGFNMPFFKGCSIEMMGRIWRDGSTPINNCQICMVASKAVIL